MDAAYLSTAYWDHERKSVTWEPLAGLEAGLLSEGMPGLREAYTQIPWLFRAVSLRADAVSKMPFRITKLDAADSDDAVVDTSAAYRNAVGFFPAPAHLLWQIEAALVVWGAAYLWRSYSRAGKTTKTLGVRYLTPTTVQPVIDPHRGLMGFTRHVNGQTIQATPQDIVYLWRPDPFVEIGPPLSSPLLAALNAANVLINVDRFAAAFFERGAIRATLLTVEGNPPRTEREALKTWWQRMMSGMRNAFATEVVSAAVKPVQIGTGIEELGNSHLIAEKRQEIAVALGVPQTVIFSGSAAGLGGGGVMSTDDRHFYDKTVVPECEWIADTLNEQLFHPAGYHLEFTPEALQLYQTEEAGLAQAFTSYVQAGLPRSLVAQMLGIELPPGWDYAALDGQAGGEPAAAERAEPADDAAKALAEQAFERDMRLWRRKSKQRGKVAPFTSAAIPEHVAQAVKVLGAEDWQRGFDWFDRYLALKERREPDPRLEAELRREIEALFKRWLDPVVRAIVEDRPIEDEALAREMEALLVQYLTRAAVESFLAQAAELGLSYDIATVNLAALQWARTYTYELVRHLNETTRRLLQEAISQYIRTPGMTIGDLAQLLEPAFGRLRADAIAVTETTRAYAQGVKVVQEVLRDMGVETELVWRTAHDELVCPTCQPMNGKRQSQWDWDVQEGPPAHVNCRCGLTVQLVNKR